MSSLYHVALSHTSSLPSAEARQRILQTGRRPDNLDRVLALTSEWAVVTMCANVTHPDEVCATSEGFFARCLSDAWVKRTASDAVTREPDPVAAAFKGRLYDSAVEFDPSYERVSGGRVPCPVFFLSLDASDDLVNTTFIVPQAWLGEWRGDDHFDSASFGSRSEEAANNRRFEIEAAVVSCAVRLPLKGTNMSKHYCHVAYHDGALYAVPRLGHRIVRLDDQFKAHPVPWSKRPGTVSNLWSDGTSLWVAKAKGGIEIRDDEVVAKIKTQLRPSYAALPLVSEAIASLPLNREEGGLGSLVYAGEVDGDAWIVTESGLIGRLGDGGIDWCMLDAAVDSAGVVATGCAATGQSFVLAGLGGVLEVSLAAIRAAMRQTSDEGT